MLSPPPRKLEPPPKPPNTPPPNRLPMFAVLNPFPNVFENLNIENP